MKEQQAALKISSQFLSSAGCPSSMSKLQRVRCIRHVNLTTVENAKGANSQWGPTEDASTFPQMPLKALKTGDFHRVPILVGTNTNEGSMFTFPAFPNGTNETGYIAFMKQLIFASGGPPSEQVTAEALSLYPYPGNSQQAVVELSNFFGDIM